MTRAPKAAVVIAAVLVLVVATTAFASGRRSGHVNADASGTQNGYTITSLLVSARFAPDGTVSGTLDLVTPSSELVGTALCGSYAGPFPGADPFLLFNLTNYPSAGNPYWSQVVIVLHDGGRGGSADWAVMGNYTAPYFTTCADVVANTPDLLSRTDLLFTLTSGNITVH
jgi:hypothetical protein